MSEAYLIKLKGLFCTLRIAALFSFVTVIIFFSPFPGFAIQNSFQLPDSSGLDTTGNAFIAAPVKDSSKLFASLLSTGTGNEKTLNED